MTELFWECQICGIEAIDEFEKRMHLKETKTDPSHQALRTETSVFDTDDDVVEGLYL